MYIVIALSIFLLSSQAVGMEDLSDQVANAFSRNIVSGMTVLPQELQISTIKRLIEKSATRRKLRHLEEADDYEIFYVELYPSTPKFQIMEQIKVVDNQADAEMVGGSSHAILVYTTSSVLISLTEANRGIITFFQFPAISKISIQLMNTISEPIVDQRVITLSIKLMGSSFPISEWQWQLATLLSESFSDQRQSVSESCKTSIETVFRWIEYINDVSWGSLAFQPPTPVAIQQDDKVIFITVNATDISLVIAYFASRSTVLHIDQRLDYSFPPFLHPPSSSSSYPTRLLRDYNTQEIMSTRDELRSLYEHNIHGENQLVGLSDTGIDIYSCFFHDPEHSVRYSATQPDTGHRKIYYYIPYCNDKEEAVNAHGTHVAGTLVGESNHDNSEASLYNGIAYKARLVFEDIGEGEGSGENTKLRIPRQIVNLIDSVYSCGAKIHSASWGTYINAYTSDTASIDQFISKHPDCLVVFAAGNEGEKGEGSIYSPASAKNVLSVGSVYNNPSYNDIRASFSCMGPTADGRIKPDIMAPGVNIDAAGSSGSDKNSCKITSKSGTSMSTPIVAATAVLLSQYLKEGYYPTGEAVPENGFEPTAATLKAMIIHSGQSLRGEGNPIFPHKFTSPLPDNHQGFGRMSVNDVLYWRNTSSFNLLIRELQVTRDSPHLFFNLTVHPTKALKLTMVWTDPPASMFSSNVMVNDLDLYVTANGVRYYPNNLENEFDRKNNVEVIIIPENGLTNPIEQGDNTVNITVNVNAHRLETKSQDFSLVVTGSFNTENQPVVYSDSATSSLHHATILLFCIILILPLLF